MKTLSCVLLLVALCGIATCYPLHASCKLTWDVNLNCSKVMDLLLGQISKWNMTAPCGTTEKCLYKLSSKDATTIKATHTTPAKHYVDDLDFTFSKSKGCTIKGHSSSETFYAVFDSGTNYCNLRNLADGSGLSKAGGFLETTSDSICTQFSSKNCEKY